MPNDALSSRRAVERRASGGDARGAGVIFFRPCPSKGLEGEEEEGEGVGCAFGVEARVCV